MKKLQVDPKGMAVVKKTITATLPGKTKGGVPLEPKAREKFYNDEIDRHNKILMDYPEFIDSKGKTTKQGLINRKKADQIVSARDFLIDQLQEFKYKQEAAAKAKKDAAEQAKSRAERAARPIGEKVMDFIRTTGGTGGYGGS
jgi:outer membrane murein-binding lipoprotein Lpp